MSKDNFSEEVIKFILTRSNDELGELTVEKITRLLRISRSYLYQRFKTDKNFTPGEFLVMIKMVRASVLLLEHTELSIEKVAFKFGFSSSDYFKKVFKAHFGTTPGRYRKYHKEK